MNSPQFDKSVQALNYIASRGDQKTTNKLRAIKLIWAADRYHLRKYGRTITEDRYVAMKLGPVASNVKDIADEDTFIAPEGLEYAAQYIKKTDDGLSIKSLEDPDLGVFSDTDIEALDFAIEEFGKFGQFELSDIAHKYPEWSQFEDEFNQQATAVEEIKYKDFFRDPEDDVDDKFPASNMELLELHKEEKLIDASWN